MHRFKCLEIETAHATLDAMFEFMYIYIYIYTVRRKRVYTGSASGINCLHGADRICNVGVKVMLSEVIWKRLCAINITGQSCAQQAYKTLKRYCCY